MSDHHHRGRGGHGDHDWQSQDYVARWIARDEARADERSPILARMLGAVPFAAGAPIEVLDVGGGSGVVSEALVRAFPQAQVTLQDYSGPMLERARERFGKRAGSMRYVGYDLRDPAWEKAVGGPFDLVVSGIAIHNLHDMQAITACYGVIRRLLKPGGCFLDYDHFDRVGGLATHRDALLSVGFARVETVWHEVPTAVLKASV
jgi:ubiquinone/menaquinone biosynthesis C-methylase UbiE